MSRVQRLPRKVKVYVAKSHACNAKCTSISKILQVPRLTGRMQVDVAKCTQTAAATTASTGNQARRQSQPSAISATPATQSARPCLQVPRLPRKSEGRCRQVPRLPRKVKATASTGNQARHQSQPSAISATPAMQSEDLCRQVPRLPRKVKVDAAKCHACHANSRGDNGFNWEPSAPPEPAQCHKCHACHAK